MMKILILGAGQVGASLARHLSKDTENGERKFKAHLTEKLPTKDNLSIQG
jgi:predicted dinucleotide-binding enzyme